MNKGQIENSNTGTDENDWQSGSESENILIGHFKAKNTNEEPQYNSLLNYIWLKHPATCAKRYSLGEASPWKGWSSAAEQAQAGSLQEKVVTSILFSWETEKLFSETKMGFVPTQNLQVK